MCIRMPQSACPTTATLACWSLAAASGIQAKGHNAGSRPRSQQQGWPHCSAGRGDGEQDGRQPPACSHGMLLAPQVDCYHSVNDTIYSYGALTLDGDEYIPFERYKGKTVLFVNVATY